MTPSVLLLNPPGDAPYLRDHWCSHVSKGRYLWHPYDLLAMTGGLAGRADVCVIDAIAERLSPEATVRRALEFRPDLVVMVSGQVSWRRDLAFLARLRSEIPGVRTAASGEIYVFDADRIISRCEALDAVILDFTDCDLLPLVGVDGALRNVVVRDGARVRTYAADGRGPFALGVPRYEWFPRETYGVPQAIRRPLASFMSNLGCPYRCRFCPFERLPSRVRDLDDAVADLAHAADLGLAELWLKDQSFGVYRKHAEALLDRMVERRFGFTWSCETRPDLLDPALADRMVAAGCHTVLLGAEAADDGILERAYKGYRTADVRRGFAVARAAGLRTLAHFCIGLPGETPETLSRLGPYVEELAPDFISVNVATPKVGTSFRDEALAEGWIGEEETMLDSSASRPAARLPGVSPEAVWEARTDLLRRFYLRPSWMARRVAHVRSGHEARTLAREGLGLVLRGLAGREQPATL